MKYTLSIIIIIIVIIGAWFVLRKTPSTNGLSTVQQNMYQKILADGKLKIEELAAGSGAEAKAGDTVSVNYKGMLEDGTIFDETAKHGAPIEFMLAQGQVIQGWDLGILGMKVGEKRRLTIASDLAYGDGGYGPIPPKATLIFEVELVGIK
jgi:FKBP-type peptidyl-prolyl cis-trans isomerase